MSDIRYKVVEQISAWHRVQGINFDNLAKKLERDKAKPLDIEKARWASASHNAHATAIIRLFQQEK